MLVQASFGAIDGLNHGFYGGALLQAALTHQRPPGEEAERQPQHHPLLRGQPGAEHVLMGRHIWPEAHFDDLSRERMRFGVAQYARGELGIALIPAVDRQQPDADVVLCGIGTPCVDPDEKGTPELALVERM